MLDTRMKDLVKYDEFLDGKDINCLSGLEKNLIDERYMKKNIDIIKFNTENYLSSITDIICHVEEGLNRLHSLQIRTLSMQFDFLKSQYLLMTNYAMALGDDLRTNSIEILQNMANEAYLGLFDTDLNDNEYDILLGDITELMIRYNGYYIDEKGMKCRKRRGLTPEEREIIQLSRLVNEVSNPNKENEQTTNFSSQQPANSEKPIKRMANKFEFVQSTTTFSDVAGLKEVKEDLLQIVDYIKCPEIYKQFGAKLPKGTILYGPPGTGKTLLARAVAGEAEANFIALSSTDFTAKHWGVVPQKIKDLFETAKDNAPCIIFIDEIDMLGMDRGADASNSLPHRETLNAFLTAMDGFDQFEGVTILAATNRLEDLDPALTRPGRFDNQFSVPLPHNIDEVKEVISIYIRNKMLSPDCTVDGIASKFIRQSPATIESIINEACLIAIRKNNGVIRTCDIHEAYMKKTLKGHVRETQDASKEELKVVAIHEAGHALAAVMQGRGVQSVSVMGTTTGAGGVTFTEPLNTYLLRKSDFEKQIRISYGGRAAEEVCFGKEMISTGSSADIKKVTEILVDASSNYGFDMSGTKSDIPAIAYTRKELSKDLIEKASVRYYDQTVHMFRENKSALLCIAKRLLNKGTIPGDEVKQIYLACQNKKKELQNSELEFPNAF